LSDSASSIELDKHIRGFNNASPSLSVFESNLLRYFPGDVINGAFFSTYYNNGFTAKFFSDMKDIEYYLPSIPSPSINVAKRISHSNYSVFLCPSTHVKMWRHGREEDVGVGVNFWESIINTLLHEGILPIIWINPSSYDMSTVFGEKCVYITDSNILSVMSAIRASSCLLDICSGTSKFAIMARSPFLHADVRQRYFATKEYEIDDLCSKNIPKEHVFLFNNAIDIDWNYALMQVMVKLKQFLPKIDRTVLMSTSEMDDVLLYDDVRRKKNRKVGLHFIKVSNEEV
jgi:hypothetical protein